MVIGGVEEIVLCPVNPVVSHHFSAGVAEAGFTGKRDSFCMVTFRALICEEAHTNRIAARHYFFHILEPQRRGCHVYLDTFQRTPASCP